MWYAPGFSYGCIKAKVGVLSMEKNLFLGRFPKSANFDSCDHFWWDPQGTQKWLTSVFSQISQN